MYYKTLGKTGLSISAISFGGASLGGAYQRSDPVIGERAVHFAIDQGINYFDVAPFYGGTVAETRLGEALEGRRDKIILATKVGRYAEANKKKFDFSANQIRASIEESLRRLKTDYIDVYQAHDIEFVPREQIIHETLPEMYRLKEEGKVRFVGVTAYPLHLLKEIVHQTEVDTILSYCRYNLLDTTMDEVLTPVAKENNIGLINASPLHMGVLTELGPPAWHPAPEKVFVAAQQAARYCQQRGEDISALAMQFALAYEPVSTTLVGMSKVKHVDQNLKILNVPMDRSLLEKVLAILKPVSNIYWEEGIEENFDPGAVPERS